MAEPVGILADIALTKREELAARFDGVALDALRARAVPTGRSLRAALAQPGARFLFEVKKGSPSEGAIRPQARAADIARGYAGVADGLSVLLDRTYFGGSLDDLAEARGEFDGPILAKDFFLDTRQVAEARIAGADAILVMLSLVDDATARALIAEARSLGMDALVEVHDEAEMARANALDAPLVGINNRDFRDLSIDLGNTERLAPLAHASTLISESGISTRAEVDLLAGQVDGFLVGSALMRSDSPAEAARALAFGRVKLCGLRTMADLDAGRAASFAGLMFVPESPRALSLAEARPLAERARARGMKSVGIVRDQPVDAVAALAADLGLDAVQLHGSEDAATVAAIARALPDGCETWCAVDASRPFADRGGDRLLFDRGSGGGGQAFDWSRIAAHPRLHESLLAGGIGPDNAAEAATVGAYALDVGSAVDRQPGDKSPRKIRALFEALRPRSQREGAMACA